MWVFARLEKLRDLTRFNKKFPEMKKKLRTIGSWPPGVVCERICGLRGRNFQQELPAGRRRAAARALAIFKQNAQWIGMHDSGEDRDVQLLLLNYWSSRSSDRSCDAMATRMGENANPCTPWNPVAMGVTTPVLRSTRPTSFTTFAAV